MKQLLLSSAFFLLLQCTAQAQAFVYTPQNPNFGGNTFNYAWMLSSAQAQDTYKDPLKAQEDARTAASRNPVDDFSTQLQRQLLSRLSRQILDAQFGEDTLQPGSFQFGDLTVEITEGADGLNIRIVDGNGGESNIVVPYY